MNSLAALAYYLFIHFYSNKEIFENTQVTVNKWGNCTTCTENLHSQKIIFYYFPVKYLQYCLVTSIYSLWESLIQIVCTHDFHRLFDSRFPGRKLTSRYVGWSATIYCRVFSATLSRGIQAIFWSETRQAFEF